MLEYINKKTAMQTKVLYYIVILFFLAACSSKKHDDIKRITIPINLSSPQKEIPLSSFIDKVETIRLELPDSMLFGTVSKILFTDSCTFIVDNKQEKVYRFDKKGVYLNCIGNKGRGPGEYTQLYSCFLGNDTIFIDDLSTRQIYRYTSNGNFINSFSFPFDMTYNDITYLPNGNFLCHNLRGNREKNNKELWIMNSQGEKIKTVFDTKEVYPYINSSFSTLTPGEKGNINVCDPSAARFYTFDPITHQVEEVFRMQPDIKLLSDFKGYETALNIKEKRADCLLSVDASHYLFVIWSIIEGSKGYLTYSLYSKTDQKNITGRHIKLDIPGVFSLGNYVSSNTVNALVSYYTDEMMSIDFPDEYKRYNMKENVLLINKFFFK